MIPIGNYLRDMLAGKPVESNAGSALRAAIWLLRGRREALGRELFERDGRGSPESEGVLAIRAFERRKQIDEDISALETLLARAEGRNLGPSTVEAPTPARGNGYGEI